jgi:SAM-dependent methyltransferase
MRDRGGGLGDRRPDFFSRTSLGQEAFARGGPVGLRSREMLSTSGWQEFGAPMSSDACTPRSVDAPLEAGGARDSIQGYVIDGVYPSNFHAEFTPNWIDAMLLHRGIAPPRAPGGTFALMDLGCGDGLGLIIMAAAHPEGRFFGLDALPAHVALGTRTAAECGVANVSFRCALFSDVAEPSEPDFDYVTAQGVMSWVSADNQHHVRRIATSHLRPGGIACLGYNALPGWKDALAFQQIVRRLSDEETGDAVSRFDAAVERVRAIGAAGAALFSKPFMAWIDDLRARLPGSYFPHEYLNRDWTPHWSAVMIEAMADHGFSFAAPARTDRLRDDFSLKGAQRAEIAKMADPLTRELATDIFLQSSYRVDLYDRQASRAAAAPEARLDGWWAATAPAAEAKLTCRTHAGTLTFDNDAARAIMAGLESGPAMLRTIHSKGKAGTEQDVLNGADALFIAGLIRPAGPPVTAPAAAAINALVARKAVDGAVIAALAGRYGPMPVAIDTIAHAFSDPVDGAGEENAAARSGLARLGIA